MEWLPPILDLLAAPRAWSYRPNASPASEPTALAAMALAGHGRLADAARGLRNLIEHQASGGSVGVTVDQPEPGWPTALAVLAWRSTAETVRLDSARPTELAVRWLLAMRGKTAPFVTDGHDTSLIAWPWVEGTHSWVEPTAMSLLALRATGQADHPRAQEAARLLFDRLLPNGGCNYGNTVVLGQTLRPHVAPTGWALLALAGLENADDNARQKIASSLDYLSAAVEPGTTSASLSYALLALAAHGRPAAHAPASLAAAAERLRRRGPAPLNQALLAMAALGRSSPLVRVAQTRWSFSQAATAR